MCDSNPGHEVVVVCGYRKCKTIDIEGARPSLLRKIPPDINGFPIDDYPDHAIVSALDRDTPGPRVAVTHTLARAANAVFIAVWAVPVFACVAIEPAITPAHIRWLADAHARAVNAVFLAERAVPVFACVTIEPAIALAHIRWLADIAGSVVKEPAFDPEPEDDARRVVGDVIRCIWACRAPGGVCSFDRYRVQARIIRNEYFVHVIPASGPAAIENVIREIAPVEVRLGLSRLAAESNTGPTNEFAVEIHHSSVVRRQEERRFACLAYGKPESAFKLAAIVARLINAFHGFAPDPLRTHVH